MWTRKLIAIYLLHLDSFLAILLLYTCFPLSMNVSLLFWAAISSLDVEKCAAEQLDIWMNGLVENTTPFLARVLTFSNSKTESSVGKSVQFYKEMTYQSQTIVHGTLSIAFFLIGLVQVMAGIMFLMFYRERQTALTIEISVAWFWASMLYLCSVAVNLICSEVDLLTRLFTCMVIGLRFVVTNALYDLRDVWNS